MDIKKVKCDNVDSCDNKLTIKKIYTVEGENTDCYIITDDKGVTDLWSKGRFVEVRKSPKPCPFCASNNIKLENADAMRVQVFCYGCGGRGASYSITTPTHKISAINAWNKRTP